MCSNYECKTHLSLLLELPKPDKSAVKKDGEMIMSSLLCCDRLLFFGRLFFFLLLSSQISGLLKSYFQLKMIGSLKFFLF